MIEHTIAASELKRRGISAVDEAIKLGPVHVIRYNRPRYVILSEEDYQRLAVEQQPGGALWREVLQRSWSGSKDADALLEGLSRDRNTWPDD